jgi:hypothetical protein
VKTKLILLFSALLALGGCANMKTQSGQPLTPAEIAQRVCPSIQTTLTNLQALNGLSEDAQATLAKGQKVVDVICAPGAVPTTADLQSIINNGAPLAIGIINASNMSPDRKDQLILQVTAIQLVAQGFIQAQGALAQ